MKQQIIPTNEQKIVPEGELIVSKTDLKGKILYCNDVLLSFQVMRSKSF
ncbi:hypothetical protein [Helicobacter burdigaliensis]